MKKLSYWFWLSMLVACTSDTNEDTDTDTVEDTDSGDGTIWPGERWGEATPEEYGMDSTALEALKEYAFRAAHNTQAVLVIKDGVLLAEWYSDNRDETSLVTSWSMGKSVASSLVGIGIDDGLLSLDEAASTWITEWADGPNNDITLRHLLEMRSGLPENNTNPYGVYGAEPDQLAYSIDRTPIREPGTQFSYVNEDSMILGAVLDRAFGQSTAEVAQTRLFEPLGMQGDWWTDGEGNTLTYCCIDSTARDFARFGLLFARGGEWDGQQIISESYVTESTTGVSSYGYYGLHWWVFDDNLFAAIGLHSQLLIVDREQDIVLVRFGLYDKVGTGTVREGRAYQSTAEPGPFDQETFVTLAYDAILD